MHIVKIFNRIYYVQVSIKKNVTVLKNSLSHIEQACCQVQVAGLVGSVCRRWGGSPTACVGDGCCEVSGIPLFL